MILWKVYALISLVQIILLMLGGMDLYDALCHTFTTMPTGGFSTRNSSIAHFNSVYFDCVIIFFMILADINFSLHYQMLRGKTLAFWQDSECRFFIGAVTFSRKMAADLVYAAGSVGDIYRDNSICSGILAKIIKIFTIFY